jgi:hypothetical protein
MLTGLEVDLSGATAGSINASGFSFKAVKANGDVETLTLPANSILGNATEGFNVSQSALDTAINALDITYSTYPHLSSYATDVSIMVSAGGSSTTLPYSTYYIGNAVYRGELNDAGVIHGQGSMLWNTGASYTGQYLNGVFSGIGTMTQADGTIWSGAYSAGEMNGNVAYTNANGGVNEYVYNAGSYVSLTDSLSASAIYNNQTGLIDIELKDLGSSPHAALGVDFYNNATGDLIYGLPETAISTGKFTIDPVKLIDDYSFDSFKIVVRADDTFPSNDPYIVFDATTVNKSLAQITQAQVQQAAADAILVAANEAQDSAAQTEAAARFSDFKAVAPKASMLLSDYSTLDTGYEAVMSGSSNVLTFLVDSGSGQTSHTFPIIHQISMHGQYSFDSDLTLAGENIHGHVGLMLDESGSYWGRTGVQITIDGGEVRDIHYTKDASGMIEYGYFINDTNLSHSGIDLYGTGILYSRNDNSVGDAPIVLLDRATDEIGQSWSGSSASSFTPRSSSEIVRLAVENDSSTTITTLSATHSSSQTLTFAIDASKHNGANFTLDGNSLKAIGSGLDYEQDNYQKVEVVVTDQDGYSVRYTMNVNIKNIDEGSAADFGGSDYKGPVWSSGDQTSYTSSNAMSTPVENLYSGYGWGTTPGQGVDLTYSFSGASGDTESVFESGYFEYSSSRPKSEPHDFENSDKCACFSCISTREGEDSLSSDEKTSAAENTLLAISPFMKSQAKHTLDLMEEFTLLNFSEVTETASGSENYGQIRLLSIDLPSALGSAYKPYPSYYSSGDIYIDNSPSILIADAQIETGEDAYNTIIHEFGHAVGLDHPFGGLTTEEVPSGSVRKSVQHTVMSYDTYSGYSGGTYVDSGTGAKMGYFPQTWMIDDIAALQYMYGVNEQTNRIDNTYNVSNLSNSSISDGIIYQTIWDAAGTDTISWENQATVSHIDLNPGMHSFFGDITSIADTNFMDGYDSLGVGDGILGIAYGADIENVIGGINNDHLTGNSLGNNLTGGAGSDIMSGGTGADIFHIGSGASGINPGVADTILDFTTNVDKINITDAQIGAGEAQVSDGSSFADWAALVADVGTNFTDTDDASNVQMYYNGYGTGNGFIFIDSDNDGTLNTDDNLIVLTGVNLSSEIAISDIV